MSQILVIECSKCCLNSYRFSINLMAEEKKKKQKKHEKIFAFRMIRKHHKIIKDVLLAIAAVSAAAIVFAMSRQYSIEIDSISQIPAPLQIAKNSEEILPDPPSVDTADWKAYNNPYYGFKLKYPPDWKKPTAKTPLKGSKWQYRYLFRKGVADESNPYIGFDVNIYDAKKVNELANTEEFSELKNQEQENNEACIRIEEYLSENPDHPAKEIYISPTDDCRATGFFYTLTRDEYIYNFIPVLKEGTDKPENPKKEAIKNFPEFFGMASSIELIDIARSKPQAVDPQTKETSSTGITCIKFPPEILTKLKNPPMPPDSEKKDGKRVCHVLAEGHKDNPHKSKKNPKGGWGGCCYDPDEVPNPRCCYPVGSIYEKLLKHYFEHPFYPKK